VLERLQLQSDMSEAPIESVVRRLVEEHFGLEPLLERIVWFRDGNGAAAEIRLIEVSTQTLATGRVDVFAFGPTPDTPYLLRIAEVTPAEWDQVRRRQISLPDDWTLDNMCAFERQGADGR